MGSTFFHFTDLSPSKEALASTTFLLGSARRSTLKSLRQEESGNFISVAAVNLGEDEPEVINRDALIILKNLQRFSLF